ncbi:hypothetical protein ACFU5P_28180 [Streptomyces sp. NPDC057433]|uniref:hypothetical protein n=1 Tax=Streptomyces sp. NPDC057433 TaxID=3346132 RepID=UPI00369D0856
MTPGRGVFADKRRLMLDHARGYDVHRPLQVFRANAGPPSGPEGDRVARTARNASSAA